MKTTVLFAAILFSGLTGFAQEVKSAAEQQTKSATTLKGSPNKSESSAHASVTGEAGAQIGTPDKKIKQTKRKGQEIKKEIDEKKQKAGEKSREIVEESKSELKQNSSVSAENNAGAKVDAENRNNFQTDASLQSNSSVSADKGSKTMNLKTSGNIETETNTNNFRPETDAVKSEGQQVVVKGKTTVHSQVSAGKNNAAGIKESTVKTSTKTKAGLQKKVNSHTKKSPQAKLKAGAHMKTNTGLKLK